MVKKVVLVSLLFFVFGAYVLKMRFAPSDSISIVAPSNLQTSTPASNSQSTTSQGIPTTTQTTAPTATIYKDGTYTGNVTDAFYGNIQVQTTVAGGKITDVVFLQYPNDRSNSVLINSQAMPYLKQEAIQAQSAQVEIVSGATQTSNAFIQSLGSALSKAQ